MALGVIARDSTLVFCGPNKSGDLITDMKSLKKKGDFSSMFGSIMSLSVLVRASVGLESNR